MPRAEIESRQVVVVGSGFGGAVTACRLAQAGCDVLVLERGRWFDGDFPRDAGDDWLWEQGGRGPFDVRRVGGVTAVVAAGVGGGSLLYSNVHLRLPAEVFGSRWPAGWTREALNPYYDLVASMLDLKRADEQDAQRYWPLPPRAGLLREAATRLGAAQDVFHPPLALDFGDPRVCRENRFGARQSGCRHCGKCSVGCNVGAKNSLDKNYLPLAMHHGAAVRARCEVVGLARDPDGGYRVTYRCLLEGTEHVVVTPTLVLAAGTLGTTELLLSHGAALGATSSRIGDHYSANGDYLITSLGGIEKEWRPGVGPAITTSVLADDGETWFLVQDGGIPALDVLLPGIGVRSDDEDPALPPDGPTSGHLGVLLAMGRDSATGKVRRRRRFCGTRLTVRWPWRSNTRFYDAERSYLRDVAHVAGSVGEVDTARLTQKAVSVHSLGGAVMADSPDEGVVDAHGEVFGAPGLYVMDGAAIPTATGVNPSHTIAAVAERNAEHLARRLCGSAEWTAPGFSAVPPYADPLPVG
ncbi:GMC oxidoreductase [Actinomycetospora sp. TBRC 11914]|uniref:GMC oxidoreductase n=1 Tax=Actinomycetospora sp. TBRC 11914 TaxID=2729387 RepID=UPI00145F4594|nr:GMC oxidoreductase [Actinomycetospora sp. TBRC 11914]NMO90308.1 GMC family oxidoreductase [Actinomycetospora sp. TBRC 11914]